MRSASPCFNRPSTWSPLRGGSATATWQASGLAAGSYQITFDAAQRANWQASRQDFGVLLDGTVVATFTPMGTSYAAYATAVFAVAAGTHTITFQGLDSAGGDNTAFVDDVRFLSA